MEITHYGLVKTEEQLHQSLNTPGYSLGEDGTIYEPDDAFIPDMFELSNTWIPLAAKSHTSSTYRMSSNHLGSAYNIEPWMLQQTGTFEVAKTNYPELFI